MVFDTIVHWLLAATPGRSAIHQRSEKRDQRLEDLD